MREKVALTVKKKKKMFIPTEKSVPLSPFLGSTRFPERSPGVLSLRAGYSSFPLYRLSTRLVSVVCVIREGVPLVRLVRTVEKMGAVG